MRYASGQLDKGKNCQYENELHVALNIAAKQVIDNQQTALSRYLTGQTNIIKN